ncbi:MAG: CopG family transcriptional regulator [Methanocella sp.]
MPRLGLRKQVYLDPDSDKRLKKWAAEKGVSEAFLIREAVDSYVAGLEGEESGDAAVNPLLRLVGMHKDPIPPDLARDHDHYPERENGR